MYNLPKKIEVAYISIFPVKPSCERVGAKARVNPSFAEKVMRELAESGHGEITLE
jgi:hypothetical protein